MGHTETHCTTIQPQDSLKTAMSSQPMALPGQVLGPTAANNIGSGTHVHGDTLIASIAGPLTSTPSTSKANKLPNGERRCRRKRCSLHFSGPGCVTCARNSTGNADHTSAGSCLVSMGGEVYQYGAHIHMTESIVFVWTTVPVANTELS